MVKGLSFNLYAGEILALVGESGSGKSVTARALVGLAGEKASVDAQRLRLTTVDGKAQDLLASGDPQWKALRGKEIGFVLQ
ncbi:ATP-binding cassette domain-containing protein, partial [Burkholderia sp. SIMBA_057]